MERLKWVNVVPGIFSFQLAEAFSQSSCFNVFSSGNSVISVVENYSTIPYSRKNLTVLKIHEIQMFSKFSLNGTQMTRIGWIFTDYNIRAHPRHPRNPCSIKISRLTDDLWHRIGFCVSPIN